LSKNTQALIVTTLLAFAGLILVLDATRKGIGVQADSTVYLDAARNLTAGSGLIVMSPQAEMVPLTHYPPLYPVAIGLVSRFGVRVETAARLLNAGLLSLNILLVGVAVAFCLRNSFWLPVLAAFLMLMAPDILGIHTLALSEPLYLATTLAGFLCLALYFENRRPLFLLAAAISIALSTLTRYVGVTAIVAGCLALLFVEPWNEKSPGLALATILNRVRRRIPLAFVFGLIAVLPLVCLSIRNRLVTSGVADRQLAFHPMNGAKIISAFSTVAQWLLLGKIRFDLRFGGFVLECIALAAVAMFVWKRGRPVAVSDTTSKSSLPALLVLFSVAYLAMMIFTITFFEDDSALDARRLLPVHVALLVLGPWAASIALSRLSDADLSRVRLLMIAMAVLLAGSYGLRGTLWLRTVRQDAQGFASRTWGQPRAFGYILKMSPEAVIYSNGFDAIHYLTGKPAHMVPEKIIHGTGRPNPHYDEELQQMTSELKAKGGVVLYFKNLEERSFLMPEAELVDRLHYVKVPVEVTTFYAPKPD